MKLLIKVLLYFVGFYQHLLFASTNGKVVILNRNLKIISSIVSTCSPCKRSRGSALDSILRNEVFDVFYHPLLGSANAQGNEPKRNLNIDTRSKDLIWAKIFLQSDRRSLVRETSQGFLYMVSFSSCWIFLIGSKKLALCSHN